MKRRPHQESSEKSQDARPFKRNKPLRLGGKGLSLEAFTNAKSKRPDYNPALIKKQKEFYKNAKYVCKFKKSLKQQTESQSNPSQSATFQKQEDGDIQSGRKTMMKKRKNTLQCLREEYEKRREEEEKARMEREAMIQAKREDKAIAEARRKELRQKMMKKTRSGQPVMKYRIEHLLQGIQGSTN